MKPEVGINSSVGTETLVDNPLVNGIDVKPFLYLKNKQPNLAYIANTSGTSHDSDKCYSFIQVHIHVHTARNKMQCESRATPALHNIQGMPPSAVCSSHADRSRCKNYFTSYTSHWDRCPATAKPKNYEGLTHGKFVSRIVLLIMLSKEGADREHNPTGLIIQQDFSTLHIYGLSKSTRCLLLRAEL